MLWGGEGPLIARSHVSYWGFLEQGWWQRGVVWEQGTSEAVKKIPNGIRRRKHFRCQGVIGKDIAGKWQGIVSK